MGVMSDLLRLARLEHEALTNFKAVIDSDHAYIHDGIAFTYSSNTGELAAAATYAVAMVTPARRFIHLRPTLIHSSANLMSVSIYEGSTYTGGSAGTPVNRNRYSRKSSMVTLAYGVTPSGGTVIDALYAGQQGAGAGRTGGGALPSGEEIVLDPETTYIFQFANIGATTASTCYYRLFWYEELKGADA